MKGSEQRDSNLIQEVSVEISEKNSSTAFNALRFRFAGQDIINPFDKLSKRDS